MQNSKYFTHLQHSDFIKEYLKLFFFLHWWCIEVMWLVESVTKRRSHDNLEPMKIFPSKLCVQMSLVEISGERKWVTRDDHRVLTLHRLACHLPHFQTQTLNDVILQVIQINRIHDTRFAFRRHRLSVRRLLRARQPNRMLWRHGCGANSAFDVTLEWFEGRLKWFCLHLSILLQVAPVTSHTNIRRPSSYSPPVFLRLLIAAGGA